MYLKTLPFNKTLFKKDFNMVKILALFIAGILFVSITTYVLSRPYSLNNLEKHLIEEGVEYNRDDLIKGYKAEITWRLTDNEAIIFILVLAPIGIIAILFGEEKRMKTFELLSVMPYRKYEIFFNKLLAALLAIVLPFVINGLIMILALGASPSLRMFYSAKQILVWILLNIYYQLPVLGFALIFGAITGTTISQVILTAIFIVFPIGFPLLVAFNLELWGLSSHTNLAIRLDKILEYSIKYSIIGVFDTPYQGPKHYIIFILLSIGMIIIAKILFDKNKIERNRETLEFEKTEGFFKVGVSICTALLMAVIFIWIFNGFISMSKFLEVLIILIGYIIGGLLGYFLAQFSIKVNKSKA